MYVLPKLQKNTVRLWRQMAARETVSPTFI